MEKNDFEWLKSSSGKKRIDFVTNPIISVIFRVVGIINWTTALIYYTGRHFLDKATRLYFSEGFWCAESESDLRIAPSPEVF